MNDLDTHMILTAVWITCVINLCAMTLLAIAIMSVMGGDGKDRKQ